MKSKRLFIGFPITNGDGHWLKAQVVNKDKALTDSIRWTIDGNFHITSVFLGDTDAALIPHIVEAMSLAAKDQEKTAVLISKMANFPHYKANLLAALITPSNCLSQVRSSLITQLSGKIRLDNHDYQPHITLARGLGKEHDIEIEQIDYKIKLTDLVLYESFVQTPSNKYQMLHKCELF